MTLREMVEKVAEEAIPCSCNKAYTARNLETDATWKFTDSVFNR